jgi:predicted site-specific integrase-resolvase
MGKLLTKKELAERWQVSPRAIEQWVRDGRISPCKQVPGDIRFSPEYIAELEGVKLDKLSPLERRRLEKEIESLREKLQRYESAMAKVNLISGEIMYLKAGEEVS